MCNSASDVSRSAAVQIWPATPKGAGTNEADPAITIHHHPRGLVLSERAKPGAEEPELAVISSRGQRRPTVPACGRPQTDQPHPAVGSDRCGRRSVLSACPRRARALSALASGFWLCAEEQRPAALGAQCANSQIGPRRPGLQHETSNSPGRQFRQRSPCGRLILTVREDLFRML